VTKEVREYRRTPWTIKVHHTILIPAFSLSKMLINITELTVIIVNKDERRTDFS
jgi:hypothetical protein